MIQASAHLVELAKRLSHPNGPGSSLNLLSIVATMNNRIRLHNKIRLLEIGANITSRAIGVSIRAYITGGASLPADIMKKLGDSLARESLAPVNLLEFVVAADFAVARSHYERAMQVLKLYDIAVDGHHAYDYLRHFFEGNSFYYPALHLIDKVDHINKTLGSEILGFFGKGVDEVVGGYVGRVKFQLDSLKTLGPVLEYTNERRALQTQMARVLAGDLGQSDRVDK